MSDLAIYPKQICLPSWWTEAPPLAPAPSPRYVEEKMAAIMAALRAFGKPAPAFLIAERLGKPVKAVSNILVVLEIKGAVRRVRGTDHTLWEAL